jgi:hypothetical protein
VWGAGSGGEWLVCSSNKSPQLWWGERYGPTHHFSASNSDFYLPKWPFSLLAGTVNVSALITMRGYCRPVRLLADFFLIYVITKRLLLD